MHVVLHAYKCFCWRIWNKQIQRISFDNLLLLEYFLSHLGAWARFDSKTLIKHLQSVLIFRTDLWTQDWLKLLPTAWYRAEPRPKNKKSLHLSCFGSKLVTFVDKRDWRSGWHIFLKQFKIGFQKRWTRYFLLSTAPLPVLSRFTGNPRIPVPVGHRWRHNHDGH